MNTRLGSAVVFSILALACSADVVVSPATSGEGGGGGDIATGPGAGGHGGAGGQGGDAGKQLWSKRFDASLSQGVAVDSTGSIVVTGFASTSPDFGGGPLSCSASDAFVAKYDAAGNHVWSKCFGGLANDRGLAVATDDLGNVVVTGFMELSVDFGGGVLTSAGDSDIFVAKYDGAGNHLWSKRFGDSADEEALAVAADSSGNVVVAGYFRGSVDFGGGPLSSAGGWDIFVAKYDDAGNHLWSKRFGDSGADHVPAVATDSADNVVVTGAFNGSVDFGGGALSSAGDSDIFVAKYDGAGNHLWSKRFGLAGYDAGIGTATDESGDIVITGHLEGSVDVGGGPLTGQSNSVDMFVAKYDSGGNHLWSRRAAGRAEDVAMDGSGNVIATGGFEGASDFGGGPLTSAGAWDVFVVKYDNDGNHLWSKRFGDAADESKSGDIAYGVATDGSSDVVITGKFYGTVDFGGGPLSTGGFVAKFAP